MVRKTPAARPLLLPGTMTAAAIDRFGPPSVLTRHVLPVPEVGPREVLIRMHAAGVGVWDAEARDGSWRPWGKNAKFPLVIGTDGAGIVAAKGSAVRRFALGDRVWAFHVANPKGGFYAEYVAVDAACAGPLPQLRIVSVGGQAVPANPKGTFNPVDVTINTTQVVGIQLEGRNIPPAR